MKSNQIFSKTMAAVAIALPALGILALTGCTSDETFETPANEARTVTFTAVAPEGAGSRALWDDATSGKLGFEWEAETDTKIDLYWTGATEPLQREATLDGHDGASVTVTGTALEGATEVVALFPANTIQVGNGEMYRTLPTTLTQKGAGTAHLRDYMYLNGTLPIGEVTEGAATMQLAHGCAVLRFNVSNGGETAVRVTRVEMLAASGKTGVNTRAAITAANAESGIIHSAPQNIAVAVQDATDDTKGHLLAAENGSLAVYAHCFPTNISDGQFQFCITVTDEAGEAEKHYITKETFSVANITTTDDTDTEQKMFKAGYYYTFNLDIAGSRFEELQDYVEVKDGDNVTGYIVNTYAGLQAWRAAVMNEGGTMKDADLNLTLGMDIILPAVAEDGSNWTPVGGAYVNTTYQTYTGTIDGGGHTISGLVINSSNLGGNGFIGRMDGGSITNLKLADVRVTGSDGSTGALVGDASNTDISDCEVTGGTVSGSEYMGGLIGKQSYGSITRCINRAAVTTTGQNAGGIVGFASEFTISECGNYGAVESTSQDQYAPAYVGGMAGEASSLTITNCTNYAASITGQYAGYLAGYADVDTKNYSSSSGNENQSGNSDLKEYGNFEEDNNIPV